MKKFAIVLAVMLGVFSLNGIAFADTIVQDTVPKERKTIDEYDRALEHYNRGEYQKSINILKDYIKKTPDPWGYWLMGYSLYKLKRFDEANVYFKNAYLVDPSFSPTPTLEKELNHPYEPARPEGYPEGMSPTARTAPIPKLQQGTTYVMESEEEPAETQPVEPAPEEPAPAPSGQAPQAVPPPATTGQAPQAVPPPATTGQAPQAVPPPATTGQAPQAVPPPATTGQPPVSVPPPAQQSAQPEAPQEVTPPTPPPAPAPKPAPTPAPKSLLTPEMTQNPLAPYIGLIAGLGTTLLLAIAAITFLLYLIFSLIIYKIAKKLNVAAPFLAFIPIIQYWTLSACAGMSILMTILLFILHWIFFPLAWAIIFMGIAGQLGKSRVVGFLIGLLYIIPLFWLVAWFLYARGGAVTARGTGSRFDDMDLGGEPDIPDLDFDLEEEEPAPKRKTAAPPEEVPSLDDDDWQLPEENARNQSATEEWQLPNESNEDEQSVDDWQLPQDDEEN